MKNFLPSFSQSLEDAWKGGDHVVERSRNGLENDKKMLQNRSISLPSTDFAGVVNALPKRHEEFCDQIKNLAPQFLRYTL